MRFVLTLSFLFFAVTQLSAQSGVKTICSKDPKKCHRHALCTYATEPVSNSKTKKFQWDSNFPRHVAHAKRSGLRCGVVGPSWSKNSNIMQAFNSLSEDTRRNLQNELKKMGLYTANVDGKYGPSTQSSIERYNSSQRNLELSSRTNAEKLLAELSAGINSGSCDLDPQRCTIAKLCQYATSESRINNRLVWTSSTKYQPHIAEAKSRDLSCGVSDEVDENLTVEDSDANESPMLSSTETSSSMATTAKASAPERNKAQISPEQLVKLFDNEDYQVALLGAQLLAPTGDPTALYLLGRMYADGLGVLQQFKRGHMWLNLASLNGSSKASETRNDLQAQMPPDAVVEAQAMALTCLKSGYSECGLPSVLSTSVKEKPSPPKDSISNLEIERLFRTSPVLRRKQLQYALKELGLYASAIDAKWGRGTQTAINNFIKLNDREFFDVENIFQAVLSRVDVPNKFVSVAKKTAPKQKVTREVPPQNTIKFNIPNGWRTLSNNMTHSFVQADSICKPQSRNAGRGVKAAPMIGGPSFNCGQFGTGFNCNSDPTGMQGFANTLAQIGAKRDAYDSCMAQYGWKSTKKRSLFGG